MFPVDGVKEGTLSLALLEKAKGAVLDKGAVTVKTEGRIIFYALSYSSRAFLISPSASFKECFHRFRALFMDSSSIDLSLIHTSPTFCPNLNPIFFLLMI